MMIICKKYVLIIFNVTQLDYVPSYNEGKVSHFENTSIETIHLQNELAK